MTLEEENENKTKKLSTDSAALAGRPDTKATSAETNVETVSTKNNTNTNMDCKASDASKSHDVAKIQETKAESKPERIVQKETSLRKNKKTVCDKPEITRQELQLQQKNMQECDLSYEKINELSLRAMMKLEEGRRLIVGEATSVEQVIKPQTTSTRKQKVVKKVRLSRVDMQEQIEGLQELISQLTLSNPDLQTHVHHLASQNPKLKKLKLFTIETTTASYNETVVHQHQPPSSSRTKNKSESKLISVSLSNEPHFRSKGGGSKARKESERSATSSTASQKDSIETAISIAEKNQQAATKKSQRRNGRTKKNKSNQQTKCQASEEEALAKYINTIVSEYLGDKQQEQAAELKFNGGVDDLEPYAERLVQAGLGRIVEEEIRINRKNNRQSFVTMSSDREGTERDGIILLPVARRYAFEGDTVKAFVMNAGSSSASVGEQPVLEKKKMQSQESTITGGKEHSFCIADDEDPFENEDSDLDPTELDTTTVIVSDNCPKAFVISIVKQTVLRQVVGTISFKNAVKLNDARTFYKLKPHDMRVPMVYIPEDVCTAHISEESKKDICGFLYLAQVRETDSNGHCIGELVQVVGKVGNLDAEIKAILLHNGLKDIRPYEDRFNELFTQPDPPVSSEELKTREDLRRKCVFTIDPLTARDLDDAMSLERVGDDEYEIGVHISDVTHYLQEDSELDNIVKERATSIYLVNEVIHMLPKSLCFKCSLLPGEDKYAFSVFWRMNSEGEILGNARFTRSIINSCTQFAYEHAQKIIDNPREQFDVDDFPTICNKFGPVDIVWRVLTLHMIAQQLRKKRYDAGALSINNPKLHFSLDPSTGEPLSYEVDGRQEANFLIEEFMLLANQSVARFIYEHFPDTAILRNHAPPLAKSMKALREKLNNLGMEFDSGSSKTMFESMQRLCCEAPDPKAMDVCLSTLLTKPMARAKYYCSEGKTEEVELWHYALSIPIYTHFTSPIRRYPDILVHRLLAASLNYCSPPKRTCEELHHLAKVCNDQKFNAKNAGDESINLFFKRYIKAKQYLVLRAVVMEIYQHLVNVVTIETGHVIAINYKIQKVLVDTSNAPAFILISEKNSKSAPLKLQIFSTVDVKLVIWDDKICGFFMSPDPKQRQLNSIESSKKKQQKANSGNYAGANGIRKQQRTSQEAQTTQEQCPNPQSNGAKPKTKASTTKHSQEKRIYAMKN